MATKRGTYVLYDDVEIMKRIKNPQTLQLLKSAQEFYETRSRRKLYEKMGCEMQGIKEAEKTDFNNFLEELGVWLGKKPKL